MTRRLFARLLAAGVLTVGLAHDADAQSGTDVETTKRVIDAQARPFR
jgi:hypothetical protein